MSNSFDSIVIPAFRASGTLRRAVDSCVDESSVKEIIVVLDGPDPESLRVLPSAPKVKVVALAEPRGAPACRNMGLRLVDSEYVLFLDADDYLEAPFLRAAREAADAAHADVTFGRFCFEFPDGRRSAFSPAERYGELRCGTVMKKWLLEQYTPPCALLWRTSFVREMGGWDESLAKNQDGDFMYRALLRNPIMTCCVDGQGVYVQDDNPGRITKRNNRRTLQSQIRVLNKVRVRVADQLFDASRELGVAYYNLARLAFCIGERDIGRDAERAARELGVKGEPGSIMHSLLAGMLGLQRKQELARTVRRFVEIC